MKLSVLEAIEHLKKGRLVAIPTETVYGLAASISDQKALEGIFIQKNRPQDNPLIVHISDLEQLNSLWKNPPNAAVNDLISTFWPGPLTLIAEKHTSVKNIVTAQGATVAVRMPNHDIALEIISKTGPLAAPSANTSTRPSPTQAQHVEDDFGTNFPVVDGGSCDKGLESTVLSVQKNPWIVYRPGNIGFEDIKRIASKHHIDVENYTHADDLVKVESPGLKYPHYSPNARVRWLTEKTTSEIRPKDVVITHHIIELKLPPYCENINFDANYAAFAQQLYHIFLESDKKKVQTIWIEPFPENTSNADVAALKNRISKAVAS